VDSDKKLTKEEFWKLMAIKSPLTNPYTVKFSKEGQVLDEKTGIVTVVLLTSGAGENDRIVVPGGHVKITYKIKIK
jgi:hypothetical protein